MAPSAWRPLDGTGVLRISGRKNKNKNKNNLKIGTWNVRTLYEAGRLKNLLVEMQRLDLQIMGVCETRWPDATTFYSGDYAIYTSGTRDESHRNGVAVILKKSLSDSVRNFLPLSDRVMLLQLETKPINVNIIQVYAPTTDYDDNEVELFYQQIKEVMKATKKHEITLIMGDWNAKVGKGATEDVTGEYGLGIRNDRGNRLIQFCQEEEYIITNTWYKLPFRRLYTWMSPQHTQDNIVRNQIDFILINRRFRNCIKSTKTYPGADAHSDHNLLCSILNIKLKQNKKSIKTMRTQQEILKEPEIIKEVNDNIHKIAQSSLPNKSVEQNWQDIKASLMNKKIEHILQPKEKKAKKEWMTQDILNLMEERRKHKNKNQNQYKQIHRTIRKKIKEAKELWLQESCKEIEHLQSIHDDFNLHKKLKEHSGIYKRKKTSVLQNANGDVLITNEDRCNEWQQYIQQLFEDETRKGPESILANCEAENGPPILKSEVEKAIRQSKTRKTPGPDEIPVELLKILDDESISVLTAFFNQVYQSGELPNDWQKSIFIALPKNTKASRCSDFRLISLMSHVLKILLKILLNRIYDICDQDIGKEQFGFRNGLGTREALFSMRVLLQKSCEFRKNLYICFIDFEKAFDRVKHTELFQCLKSYNVDNYDLRLLINLYHNQFAVVRVDERDTREIPIRRGVRQGCVLSPLLFNLYSENIFREALYGRNEGVKIGGEIINNIRYADDTAIIAESMEDLQRLLDRVFEVSQRWGININIKKTKWMAVGKIHIDPIPIIINGHNIELVTHFRYLGSWLNNEVTCDEEIKTRIEIARRAFKKWYPVFTNRNISIQTRLRTLRCYIWSILLYGCETWTLKIDTMNKIEAFEMWCYRRILRISWTTHTTNEEILRQLNKERELLITIKTRKASYFGHIIRGTKYYIPRLIIQGKVEGRRWIGRKKLSWLRNLRNWTGLGVEQLFRAARNRDQFKEIVMGLANA